MNMNFTEYSIDQLMECLEGVDDQKYPKNALTIYKTLLMRLNLDSDLVGAKTLGFENFLLLEIGLQAMIGGTLATLLMGDTYHNNDEMSEKILRCWSNVITDSSLT